MTGITSLTDKDRIFTNLYGYQSRRREAVDASAATRTRSPT